MRHSLLFLPLFLLASLPLEAQPSTMSPVPGEGTEFRFGFIQNEENTSTCALFDASELTNQVWVTSRFHTSFTITLSDSSSYTFRLEPGETESVAYRGDRAACSGERICSNTIHITADDPVRVRAASYRVHTMEATTILPVREWGHEYVSMNMPVDHYDLTGPTAFDSCSLEPRQGEVGIVANVDSTLVRVLPSVRTGGGLRAGKTHQRLLMAGEMWQIQAGGSVRGTNDLTGTLITADQPVMVLTGHVRTGLPAVQQTKNHLVEVLPPTGEAGRRYVAAPLYGTQATDMLRIMLLDEGPSTVTVHSVRDGDVNVRVDTLPDRHSWVDLEIEGPVSIDSEGRIQVAQYTQSNSLPDMKIGDPSMVILRPLGSTDSAATLQPLPITTGISRTIDSGLHLGSVFVRTRSLRSLMIGGVPQVDHPALLESRVVPGSGAGDSGMTWLLLDIGGLKNGLDVLGGESIISYVAGASAYDAYSTRGYAHAEHAPPPALSARITDLDFGNVRIGTTVCVDLTLTNTSSVPLRFDEAESTGSFLPDASVVVPIELQPGESRPVRVCFTPDSLGNYSGTLTLRDGARSFEVTARLSGNGVDRITSVTERSAEAAGVSLTRVGENLLVRNDGRSDIRKMSLYGLTGERILVCHPSAAGATTLVVPLPPGLARGVYHLVLESTGGKPVILPLAW